MIGLLAMAYGTPDDPDDVERYYTDIRRGRPPSPEQLADLKGRYEAIGNDFPLARITRAQATGLERELNRRAGAERFRAYLGMKHSPTFIPDAVDAMAADGVERAVGLVLAPHYSRMSVGDYVKRAMRAPRIDEVALSFVESWWEEPAFLDLVAARVEGALGTLGPDEREGAVTVFTAHSLPEKIVAAGDPYPDELRGTAEAVAERAGLRRFTTAWQSEGHTGEPWLGPRLEEVVERLASEGAPAVCVCACGFVADHLEVLYDIDIEAQELASELGIRLVRTEQMNDDPRFLAALADVVERHLEGVPAPDR